ncbi:NUDIX hydrolase [Octadecabacter sp.]|nr:NUDIX hydrolase [Octadecabacter sp.]
MNGLQQRQIDLGDAAKTELRTQFAALCYRIKDDKLQFCIVTSRRSGRWIIPKGWPMHGETPMEAAATEAYEEAGVRGKIKSRPIGVYSYYKVRPKEDELPCIAVVYPLRVKRVLTKWPEKKQRQRKWVSRKKAAQMVDEPELREIMLQFKPE